VGTSGSIRKQLLIFAREPCFKDTAVFDNANVGLFVWKKVMVRSPDYLFVRAAEQGASGAIHE
jgi:hypothetical protein